MANEQVNVPVNLTDNGSVDNMNKGLSILQKHMKEVEKQAEAMGAAFTGFSKASAAIQSSQQASVGVTGGGVTGAQDYRTQKGVAGATGASARDFARQAEGLGGLVKVYATFAANIFAVSTAFNALKSAADVSNMVKGLDQLGASSGRNLGFLAQQLVAVSGGAVSLKDSLDAVAKGSAANLTNSQMLRMAEVAKTASQALGRSMPDALDRLIRGTSKIEPELLDELGILVKVKDASDAYARSLGKTEASLTDFEKRQAFTNAVIEQGEKKFGDISVEANSYSKIVATASNVLVTALQGINVVLEPLVKFLGEHPTALAGVFVYMGSTLVKQAIPAIGQFRKSLDDAAEKAAKRAKDIREVYVETAALALQDSADKNAKRLKQVQDSLDKESAIVKASKIKQDTAGVGAVLSKDPRTSNLKDLALLEAEHAKQVELGNIKNADRLLLQKAYIENNIKLTAEENTLLAEQLVINEKLEAVSVATLRTEEGRRAIIAQQSAAKSAKASIITEAFKEAQEGGLVNAWKNINTKIKDSEALAGSATPKITALTTRITAGLAAVAAEAVVLFEAVAAAAGPVILVVTALYAAFELLDTIFSTNAKQVEVFSQSMDGLNSAITTVNNSLDTLNKKGSKSALSPEMLQAQASALSDLADSFDKSVSALIKLDAASSGWDNFIDGFKSIFGAGRNDKIAESFGKGIESSLKAALTGDAKDALVEEVSKITGLAAGDLTAKNITKALENIPASQYKQKLEELTAANDKFAKSQAQVAASAVKVSESLKEAGLRATDLINSLIPSDPEAKFGIALINSAIAIGDALRKGPIAALADYNDIVKDASKLKVFSPDSQNILQSYRSDIESINKSIEVMKANRAKDQGVYDASVKNQRTTVLPGGELVQVNKINSALKSGIDEQTRKIAEAEQKAGTLAGEAMSKVIGVEFDRGAKLLETSVKNAFELAALSVQKAAASSLTGRGAAAAQADIALKELEVQQRNLEQQKSLLDSQYMATNAIELNTIAIKENTLQAQKDAAKQSNPGAIPGIENQMKGLETSRTNLEKAQSIIQSVKGDYKQLLAESSKFAATDPLVSGLLANKAQSMAGIAAQQAKLNADKQIVTNAERLKQIGEEYDRQIELNNQQKAATKIAEDDFNVRVAQHKITGEDIENGRTGFKLINDSLNTAAEQLNINKQITIQKEAEAQSGVKIQGTQDMITKGALAQAQAQQAANSAVELSKTAAQERAKAAADQLRNEQAATDVALGRITEEQASFDKYTQAYNELIDIRQKAGFSEEAEKEFAQKSALLDLERERTKEAERLKAIANEQADSAERFNTILENTVSIGQSLTEVFGKTGTVLGGIGVALAENAKKQDEIQTNLAKKQRENLMRYGEGTAELKKADAEATKKANKQTLDAELDMYTDMAKGAKSFFGQKTAAYKVFAGVEKALHIARLAMDAKETVLQLASLARTIAVNTAKQASNIATAVTAFFGQLGIFGWIGVAAMFATLVAFGISGKGGGGGGYNGPTSEQLQETAGTGQKYENGKKVDTGLGRLGESSEKSEAIAKSLEFIQKYTFENLEYSNRMLDALLAIKNNIGSLTTSILKVRGLTGGAQAEAQYSSSGPTGFSNIATKLFVNSNPLSMMVDKLTGGLVSSLTSSLFGKTSTELKDVGIKILGQTVGNIIDSGLKAVQYQVVQTTTKKIFGLVKSTSTQQLTSELSSDVKDSFTKVIKSLTDGVIGAADALGMGGQAVVDKIRGITIQMDDISLKDMKASDIPAYLESIVGSIGDQITKAALGGIEKYQQAGEDLLQTALRVARTVQIFNLQFEQMGMYISDMSIDTKLAIIDLTGGLDEFTSKANFFTENFLTASEKLAPIQKRVTEEMTRLGYASVDTVEEFKTLVQSFGQVGGISAETYAALMNVSKAFSEVYGTAADTESKLKDLAKSRTDLEFQIAQKLANAEELVRLTRQKTLDALDDSLKPLQNYIFALEDEANAKNDLIKAYQANRDAIQQTITKLAASSKALKDFNNSLLLAKESPLTPQERYSQAKEQFNTLVSIAKSTPVTEADKTARDDALSKLQGAASTFLEQSSTMFSSSIKYTEDFAAVRAALDSTANSLDAQQSDAEKQLDVANKQLDLLGVVNQSVLSVKDAMLAYSTAIVNSMIAVNAIGSNNNVEYWRQQTTKNMDILNQLNQNATPILPGLASGGIGKGLTVVGENGPELVNFDNPGMVFNNTQSQGMMASFVAPLVAEVQQLRKQVKELQDQTSQNTGALINANFIANQQNAEAIGNTIAEAEERKGWDNRSNLVAPK